MLHLIWNSNFQDLDFFNPQLPGSHLCCKQGRWLCLKATCCACGFHSTTSVSMTFSMQFWWQEPTQEMSLLLTLCWRKNLQFVGQKDSLCLWQPPCVQHETLNASYSWGILFMRSGLRLGLRFLPGSAQPKAASRGCTWCTKAEVWLSRVRLPMLYTLICV